MEKTTKEVLHNIFLVCLLCVFVFGSIQIWSVTTFIPRSAIVTENGYATYVGPYLKIDGKKLIQKFTFDDKEEKNFHKKYCDDDFFERSLQNSALENYVSKTVVIEYRSNSDYGTVALINGDHVIGRKKIYSPNKTLWTTAPHKHPDWEPSEPIYVEHNGRKRIWSPTKPLWTAEDQKRSEEYRRENWKPSEPISRD